MQFANYKLNGQEGRWLRCQTTARSGSQGIKVLYLLLVTALLFSTFNAQTLVADEGATAIEAAQQALGRGGSTYPWYDAKTDNIRPLKVAPYQPSDDPNRQSEWENQPSAANTPATATTPVNFSPPTLPWFDFIGLSFLGLLILALCAYMAWAFFKDDSVVDDLIPGLKLSSVGSLDRVSELPLELGSVRGDFLSAARREYEAGNYSQAAIYLFSHELLQLDRHQVIRLTKGKTNRQYLREVRVRPELKSHFEKTMIAFEDVFFGKHTLERRQFESCWDEVEEFHRLLPQVPT